MFGLSMAHRGLTGSCGPDNARLSDRWSDDCRPVTATVATLGKQKMKRLLNRASLHLFLGSFFHGLGSFLFGDEVGKEAAFFTSFSALLH